MHFDQLKSQIGPGLRERHILGVTHHPLAMREAASSQVGGIVVSRAQTHR
ncbi:hypothetical protein ACP6C7_09800 [Mycolicibacterium septicum]|uniref:Uncharacterized protein n=1 Tax=Mycolicibacterium septicum TaxID=98668 RepID=A0ABW9LW62_9MYCO